MVKMWQWCPASETITLESIFQPVDEFCFLAGSGISLDPPSCLPTGYQFTRELLGKLIPKEERKNVLGLMNSEREAMQDPGDFLRFEQLMEYLQRYYDPKLQVLNVYADCKVPNFNHMFLAQMIKHEHPVLTTNFDSLIEYALMEIKEPQSLIYPMIYKEDWEVDVSSEHYKIYKLHGSMLDVRNDQDSRASLQATLAQITQGKGELFQLEPWKRQVVKRLLQTKDIVVLGYSGLDDFDVLPTLWAINSSKRILWISHDGNRSLAQTQIEVVRYTESSSDADIDRIGNNLLQFSQHQTRSFDKIFRISVNTTKLLAWLWQRYVHKQHSPPNYFSGPCPDGGLTFPDCLALTEAEQWFLTGKIFWDRNLLEKSLQSYQKAWGLMQDQENKKIQGECLNDIGSILSDLGRLEDALQYYQRALEIDEHFGDKRGKITTLNNLGLLLRDQGRFDEALEHFQQALEHTEQLRDLKRKANTLSNIGLLLQDQGRFDEALLYYQQALEINELTGEIREKANSLNNIGSILQEKGQFDEALIYYQQALKIDELLGDIRGKAIDLNNIAGIYKDQGRFDEVLDYCQQSIEIFEQLGDFRRKAIILSNIGLVLQDQRRFDEALDYSQRAYDIFEQLGDFRRKATILNNIGSIHYGMGKSDKALEYYQHALQIAKNLKASDLLDVIQDAIKHIEG